VLGFIERPATVWGPSWTLPVGGVSASVSTRFGGLSQGAFASLNLGFFTGDEPARVRRNRERFAATAGFDPRRAIAPHHVHGTDVVAVDATAVPPEGILAPHPTLRADGLVTTTPRLALLVGAADCAPVFLATRDGSAVAIAHAGWRGTLAGVVGKAVAELCRRADCTPSRLTAAIGPCIGPCCFEVGEDVATAFARRLPGAVRRVGVGVKPHVDLAAAIARDLRDAGVPGVPTPPPCTRCRSDEFFSHRSGAGVAVGRMLAAVWRD
jgi:YfiH family protein